MMIAMVMLRLTMLAGGNPVGVVGVAGRSVGNHDDFEGEVECRGIVRGWLVEAGEKKSGSDRIDPGLIAVLTEDLYTSDAIWGG